MLPTISLITPSYNQGKFIKQTIDSVLNQQYPKLDYLVMDGGSTDDTVKILRSYGEKIRWISQSDKGQVDAINQGIAKTSGEIVAYLNSDDLFLPNALWKVGLAFQKQPELLWLTGDYVIIDSVGKPTDGYISTYKKWQRQAGTLLPAVWPTFLGINNPLAQPSTFWRRSVHKKVGFFNEKYDYVMDYDFWLRLFKLSSPFVLSEKLSAFRVHKNSKGGSWFPQQFAQQLQCAKDNGVSTALRRLQYFHNQLICKVYASR